MMNRIIICLGSHSSDQRHVEHLLTLFLINNDGVMVLYSLHGSDGMCFTIIITGVDA